MVIKEFIDRVVVGYLNENIQLADKVYFKTGKLSPEEREIIISITDGNNYTKLISDFYFTMKNYEFSQTKLINKLKLLHFDVLEYNKNVFPIVGYDIYNASNIYSLVTALGLRRDIIKEMKKLPSFGIRNLKNDIRKERSVSELDTYLNNLNYFMNNYSYLSNRDEDIQIKILRKMFKNNTSLKDLINFVEDKENLIGGVKFSKKGVKELSETEDFEIIYEKGDVMIIRVDSPDGIKAIGCNSLWCFTYGKGFNQAYKYWNTYSYNDMVYVLADFRNNINFADSMYVVIKPFIDDDGDLIVYDEGNEDDVPLFDLTNEPSYYPYHVLQRLFGDNYEDIIRNYINFEY